MPILFADEGAEWQKELPETGESSDTEDLLRQTDHLLEASKALLEETQETANGDSASSEEVPARSEEIAEAPDVASESPLPAEAEDVTLQETPEPSAGEKISSPEPQTDVTPVSEPEPLESSQDESAEDLRETDPQETAPIEESEPGAEIPETESREEEGPGARAEETGEFAEEEAPRDSEEVVEEGSSESAIAEEAEPVAEGAAPVRRDPGAGLQMSKPVRNVYAESFFIRSDQRLKYKLTEMRGFVFVENPGRPMDSRYAVVTDFGGSVIKSQLFPGIQSLEQGQKYLQEHLETATFEGVDIKALPVPLADGSTRKLYWVGHRAFDSADKARAEIAAVQSAVESSGGDFGRMVKEAQAYLPAPEAAAPVEIRKPANFEREEALTLKFLDALDIGNELFGPFQGTATGEKITWQSFGETSFRTTNLDNRDYNGQVAYWTNRLVFKGIRAPFSTVDPFVEITPAIESNGKDYASHMDYGAGLEWRPFARNTFLYNFRPWSMPLLQWVRNYRLYVAYFDRVGLKDEITGSKSHDFKTGVSIFYEWGVDPAPLTEGAPSTVPDYLRRYVWGEYFGDYRYEKTNFGSEDDFNAWLWNSSVILGLRLPGVPLPANPVMDDLVLMPYMRFEHINNTEFSFPYQNRYIVAAGVRWMPFNNYRFDNNEWLTKTKLFVEYVGVGNTHSGKQDDEAPNAITHDLRFGLNYSYKRF